MALELVGVLQIILPEVSGQGKNGTWTKQDFVLETQDTYPKKVCLSAWGNQVGEIKKFAIGDTLTASLNLESREYNGKWYTEARAWKITSGNTEGGSSPSTERVERQQSTPQSTPKSTLPAADLTSFEESDDLPF